MTEAGRRVVISGCSGGGKSALLAELAARGHATVPEPGRRVVAEALRTGSGALPWTDMEAFARAALALAEADLRARIATTTFHDRGTVDAAAALAHLGCPEWPASTRAYHRLVFLAPPWPEIYVTDDARRHGFEEAAAEYGRLETAYRRLGYEALRLPRASVAERADWLLDALG